MKKAFGVTLLAAVALLAAAPVATQAATTLDTDGSGTTQLVITDYTIDPGTGLPSDPGAFNLVDVSSIDFGAHSLDSIAEKDQTLTGTYDKDVKIKDTRPSQSSKDAAVLQIGSSTATQSEKDDSLAKWTAAIPASAFTVSASATNLSGVGSSLTIGGTEVLTAAGTVINETATAPVGTKTYTLGSPELTLANNQLAAKTYNGTVTYTAVSAD
ncbi:hypothetical protein KUA55_15410 [Enterococcus sp. ALS3]|uniref:WxL domain-containing protein n=1 Tax=Enterococcus alishanensis TaxID=1303817 RepID=A0ABS6TGN3_9ENTE|nr:hypothetical protein [Enterococcus alishanensis]MBV7392069.1 hypothetical protein [Enterococcus alishanensis]